MKLKNSLLFVFMVWMENGGHSLAAKKNMIVFKKNGKIAKVCCSDSEYLEINDYCQERYAMFLKQWLNNGISFINNLNRDGAIKIMHNRSKSYLEMKK